MECSICLEDLGLNQYKLSCSHIYHTECIKEWLELNSTCPMCRTPIEPLKKYVDDGIITIDRLQTIKNLILSCTEIVEELFPRYMNGYTDHVEEILEQPEIQALLLETLEKYFSDESQNQNSCMLI